MLTIPKGISQARPAIGATPTRLGQLGRTLLYPWRIWRRRQKYRRVVDLDDRMLADIGVTRAEAEWAAGLPLRRNAGRELNAVAARRRHLEVRRGR